MSQRLAAITYGTSFSLAGRLMPVAFILVSLIVGGGALAAEPCPSSSQGGC